MKTYLLTIVAGVAIGAAAIAAKSAWQAAGLPEPVSPADARVLLFIAGDERFVDEADLLLCRPHLREAAEELLAD